MSLTEKTHPIESKWIIKSALCFGILAAVILAVFLITNETVKMHNVLFTFGLSVLLFPAIAFFILQLIVVNFQFDFAERNIVLRQGVISKSERHIPYGRIQHVVISQSLMNRLLGLASVCIETASQGGGAERNREGAGNFTSLGFSGNKIGIPGLTYAKAIDLKNSLIKMMLTNPIDDAHSGL